MILLVALIGSLGGCIFGGDGAGNEAQRQITRPNSGALALDDPGAVRAFDVADMFLLDWFFRRNPEEALAHISSDVRASLSSTVTETEIEGECSFVQVEGDPLDADGTTVARYAAEGCRILPPDDDPATHIAVVVTVSDSNAWVTDVRLQR